MENDDEEKTADNNFDLDLTNELRASAMGLSVLISTNKTVVIGVNDIGKFKKICKEASRGLLEACYYLSRFFANKSVGSLKTGKDKCSYRSIILVKNLVRSLN